MCILHTYTDSQQGSVAAAESQQGSLRSKHYEANSIMGNSVRDTSFSMRKRDRDLSGEKKDDQALPSC